MEKIGKIKTFACISLDGYIVQVEKDAFRFPEGFGSGIEGHGLREFRDSVSCTVITGMYYASLQGADVWPFGDKMCYIMAPSNFRLVPGIRAEVIEAQDNITALAQIQSEVNGDIWLAGDHDFITQCLNCGLIDEITLNILPFTIGQGTSFFSYNNQARVWNLITHQTYGNGIIRAKYTVGSSFDPLL